MENRVLAEYLKTSHELRKKYEELKMGKLKRYVDQEEKYRPLLSPIQNYETHLDSQTSILKEMNSKMFSSTQDGEIGEVALKYILQPEGQVDKLYGIYRDDDGLYIGNKRIAVFNNDIFLEDDKTAYKGTKGLWELVTMQYPNPSLYSDEDLENYSDIVLKTSTYKAGNKSDGRRIKTSEGYKYTNIILPILYRYGIKQPSQQSTPIKRKGSGLQKIVTTNAFPEYVYYNNIDELLERLYILYGELKAGNTHASLKNEIIEIISEFKKF